MRIREENKVEKEQRQQEIRERRRGENRQKVVEERKCFACGSFGHIDYHYRNMEKEKPVQMLSNRFEVLRSRVMQKGEESGSEDRKMILREKRAKRRVKI